MNTFNSPHDDRQWSTGYPSQYSDRLSNLNNSNQIPDSTSYGSWEDAELSLISGTPSSLSIDIRRNGYSGSPNTSCHNADMSHRSNDVQQGLGVSPHRYDGGRSFIQNGNFSDRHYLTPHNRLQLLPPLPVQRWDSYNIQRSSSPDFPSTGQAYSSMGSRTYSLETRYPPSSQSFPIPYHTGNHNSRNVQEYRSQDGWFIRPPSESYQPVQAPNRQTPDSSQRPLLEPSDAWKRQNEEHERQASLEYRTVSNDNHPRPDPYRDRARDSTSVFPRHVNGVQFEDRRSDWYSVRSHSPMREGPSSYIGSSWRPPSPSPNFMAPVAPKPRRPVHRISARISARPRRSPSPSSASVSSSSSTSYQRGSRHGSESGSHPSSPVRVINPEFQHSREFRKSSSGHPSAVSNTLYSSRKIAGSPIDDSYSRLSSATRIFPIPPTQFTQDTQDSAYNTINEPKKDCSISPGPDSVRSSIRLSPQSSSDLEPDAILPNEPADLPCISDVNDIVDDDPDFELPGMRFQGGGKPSLDAPEPSKLILNIPDRSATPMEDMQLDLGESHIVVGESDTHESMKKENVQESTIVSDISVELTGLIAATDLPHNDTPSPGPFSSQAFEAKNTGIATVADLAPISSHNFWNTLDLQVTGKTDSVLPQLNSPIRDFPSSVQDTRPSSPLTEPLQPSPLKSSEHREIVMRDPVSSNVECSWSVDDARSALRTLIKSRNSGRHKAEQDLIESILCPNNALSDLPISRVSTSNDQVVEEVILNSLPATLKSHFNVSQRLAGKFTRQGEEYASKVGRLRAEYKAHHDRWKAHCRKLDRMMASTVSEDIPTPPTRITRRSAYFGDVARSDLEMEQIIASLDSEDMMEPNVQAMRNMAVIPDLITTDPHSINVPYVDNNGFVDDPSRTFDIYDALGSWTEDEKEKYSQAYANHPKQFRAIAQCVPGKTQAQCVLFYYLHKKDLIDFRGVIVKYGKKRKRGRKTGKGKGNALLADIIKPVRREMDGEAEFQKHGDRYLASTALRGHIHDRRRSLILPTRASVVSCVQWGNVYSIQEQSIVPDSSALIQGRLVSFAESNLNGNGNVASPIRTLQNESQGSQEGSLISTDFQTQEGAPVVNSQTKTKRLPGRPPKKHKGPQPALGNPQKTKSYTWTKSEEAEYVRLLSKYGKDFVKIAGDIPTKTTRQCRNYYQNHAVDRGLEQVGMLAETDKAFSAPNDTALKDCVF